MADLVDRILEEENEKQSKFKTIVVHKDIDLEIDEGNLLASDLNPIDTKALKSKKEQYLLDLARDNTQLLINRLWQLPQERVQEVLIAKLPEGKTQIPREKPVPKERKATKWEEYARMKGITNRKKSRMVWDEQSKEWKPAWGYKRANDDTKDWLIEVPDNADPYEDQFAKRKEAKRERVAKNELQRLRNIARSQKTKVPGVGLTPTDVPNKDHLSKALAVAKKSTASIGKFTDNLPKEKTSKYSGKKRKFEPNHGDVRGEAKKQLTILDNIVNKTPVLDVTKAVNTHILQEEQERSRKKKEGGSDARGKKRSKKGFTGKSKGKKGQFQGKKGKKSGKSKR